jgi:hypothetical protein
MGREINVGSDECIVDVGKNKWRDKVGGGLGGW